MRPLRLSFPSGDIKLITETESLTVKSVNSRPYVMIGGKRSYLTKEEQQVCASLSNVIKKPKNK